MRAFIFHSTGRGWVVGLVAVIALSGLDYLCKARFHDADYYAAHGWPKLAGFWIAAIVIQALVYAPSEEFIGVHPTQQPRKPLLRAKDTFIYIPARFWPPVLFVLGIVFYFVSD